MPQGASTCLQLGSFSSPLPVFAGVLQEHAQILHHAPSLGKQKLTAILNVSKKRSLNCWYVRHAQ